MDKITQQILYYILFGSIISFILLTIIIFITKDYYQCSCNCCRKKESQNVINDKYYYISEI